jgi:polyphenol oxidase
MLAPLHARALEGLPGVGHGFFTRDGGVSGGVYGSLNCGLGSGDAREYVLENRRRVAAHFGAEPDALLTGFQIHSATALLVERPWSPDNQPKADALVTRTPGLVLGTMAADCTPILFADTQAGVVAAAHAGWKGALGGILEATIACMERAGASRARIVAAVGPCISQAAYEVGPEFETAFTAVDPTFAAFFQRPAPEARPRFDLPGFVLARLAAAGLQGIEYAAHCTYADAGRFFSYRRMTHANESDYGRQISAIVLR